MSLILVVTLECLLSVTSERSSEHSKIRVLDLRVCIIICDPGKAHNIYKKSCEHCHRLVFVCYEMTTYVLHFLVHMHTIYPLNVHWQCRIQD